MLVVRASTLMTSDRLRCIRRSQRRQHRRHYHSGFVTGLAKCGFVVFDHVGQRHRRNHPHAGAGRLHVVGNLGLVHVEGQRFLQPEANHALGFIAFRRQSLEVEQHHADGGIGQDRDHVPRTPAQAAQRVAQQPRRRRPAAARLVSIRSGTTLPGREFVRSARFQRTSAILGDPARQARGRRKFRRPVSAWIRNWKRDS